MMTAIQLEIKAADIDEVAAELAFLRFFYNTACEWYSDGGTDEEYWIKEAYYEAGHTIPEAYSDKEE
jgi:hypothetical protein